MLPEEALAISIGCTKKSGSTKMFKWVGITTSPISDGSTTNPIVINGNDYEAKIGDVTQYQGVYFAFGSDEVWQEKGMEIMFKDAGVIFG